MQEPLPALQITVITAAAILHMGKLRLREARRLALGRRADGWQSQIPKPRVSVQSPTSNQEQPPQGQPGAPAGAPTPWEQHKTLLLSRSG